MGIPIAKSFVVKAPAAAVWAFLIDPYRVASCLPGAAITGKEDDRTFTGTMTVKVGPVTAAYRGKLRFEELDEAARRAQLSAAGQETRGKGGADMRMQSRVAELSPGETEVTVESDVNVVGVLAQFGRGMIQDVSDQMFQRFTEAMRRQLEAPAEAAPAAGAAPAPAGGAAGGGAAGGGGAGSGAAGSGEAGNAGSSGGEAGSAGSGSGGSGSGGPGSGGPGSSGPARVATAAGWAVGADGSLGQAASARAGEAAGGAAEGASGAGAGGAPVPGSGAAAPVLASPAAAAAASSVPAGSASTSPAGGGQGAADSGSGAAPGTAAARGAAYGTAAAAPPPPPAAADNVLDVGALGSAALGRAVVRTLRRPGFWIGVVVVALIVYWLASR